MKDKGPFRSTINRLVISQMLIISFAEKNILAQSANHVVISEVYGGGGNSGSTYKNDFIELYNPTDSPVSLMGWSLQYASATGSKWQATNLAGQIESHRYFLIREAEGSGGSVNLPTPDVAGSISLASTSGKIALVNSTALLQGTDPTSASIVDRVGFGNSATSYEGSGPAPAPGNTSSIERKAAGSSSASSMKVGGLDEFMGNGYDTDNNNNDFVQRSAPQPQNSASPSEPAEDTDGNGSGSAVILPVFVNASETADIKIRVAGGSDNTLYSIMTIIPDSSGWKWNKDTSDVKASGRGADSAIVTVQGDTIFISSLAVTAKDTLEIEILNLTAPSIACRSTFQIMTAVRGGIPVKISRQPDIQVISITPIIQLHNNNAEGIPAAPYIINSTVSIRGIITADFDTSKTDIYIQDATAGINVCSSERFFDYKTGDSITVAGTIAQFRGLTEIIPEKDLCIIHSHGNKLPEPVVLTTEDVNMTFNTEDFSELNEGRLVRLNSVTYNSSNQTVSDDAGTIAVYLGDIPSPGGTFDLVGILKQYKPGYPASPPYTSDYEVNPRSQEDIIISSGPAFSAEPVETNILPNSITISFRSSQPSQAVIKYGTSSIYSDSAVVTETDTIHNIVLTRLKSATIYHYQVRIKNDNGINSTADELFSTSSSASSGMINVYFNHSVDNSVSAGEDAQNINIAQEFINRISSAQYSIDAALYSLSGTVGADIADELIVAKSRGIRVRVIGEYDNHSTSPWTALSSSGVPVIFDNFSEQYSGSGLMHNKFAVFDNRDTSESNDWVWSGSWNATDPGNNKDAQNIVEIQDKSIANAYTAEFEEMWGSNTEIPNESNSRFGIRKTDNTPHRFNIAGSPVQLYFDPSDHTTSYISDALNEAVSSINIAMLTFTRSDLAQILINKTIEGEKIHVVLDNKTDSGSQFNFLRNNGADILLKGSVADGLLHHKYAIIDGDTRSADQKVITGSHNWSNSAETSNDENTLIIHNYRIANLYLQEFKARYLEADGTDIISDVGNKDDKETPHSFNLLQNYPNPFNPSTVITYRLAAGTHVSLKVFNILGQEVVTLIDRNESAGTYKVIFNAEGLSSGIYFYSITAGSFHQVKKMILLR